MHVISEYTSKIMKKKLNYRILLTIIVIANLISCMLRKTELI